MKYLHRYMGGFLLCFLLLPCCSDTQNQDESTLEWTESGEYIAVKGVMHKGPFIKGSEIEIKELTTSLQQTGKVFSTEALDNLGSFEVDASLVSPYVEIEANGFYFDEITADLSGAAITLHAIAVLDGSQTNINLLTHLARPRIKALVGQDTSQFANATKQAKSEVLSMFNIPAGDLDPFREMSVLGNNESGAVLIAVSAIVSQMAHMRSPNSPEAALSLILSDLISDFSDDGKLDSEILAQEIADGSMAVDLEGVRDGLTALAADMNASTDIAPFENYIDSDFDGVINGQDDDLPDPFYLEPVIGAQQGTEYTSQPVVISGMGETGVAAVSLGEAPYGRCNEGQLIKNGETLSGLNTKVVNGDILEIKLTLSEWNHDGCVLTVGTHRDLFAVTELYNGVPESQGTPLNPLAIDIRNWDSLPELSVDTTPSYYRIDEFPEENFFIESISITNFIKYQAYSTSDFSGTPFCTNTMPDGEWTYYCDTSQATPPIFVKVEGTDSEIGAFFQLNFGV